MFSHFQSCQIYTSFIWSAEGTLLVWIWHQGQVSSFSVTSRSECVYFLTLNIDWLEVTVNGECLGRGPGPGTERVIHISPIDHTQIYYCQNSSMLTHADYHKYHIVSWSLSCIKQISGIFFHSKGLKLFQQVMCAMYLSIKVASLSILVLLCYNTFLCKVD